MSWYWLVVLVLGGWMLVSIVVALAVGRLLAAPDGAHDVLKLEDDTGLHDLVLVRATYSR